MTKKIALTKSDKEIIRLCKGKHRFKPCDTHIDLLKKYYNKNYCVNADEYYKEFLSCMFSNLLDVFMKIRSNKGTVNSDILSLFHNSFEKNCFREQEMPIERALTELFSQIRLTAVRETKNGNSVKRFDLY